MPRCDHCTGTGWIEGPCESLISVTLPLRARSELNLREHWRRTAKRRKHHREVANLALVLETVPVPPVRVRLVRVAPRRLDSHDNLRASLKAVADGVADWLDVDDGSDDVIWEYGQERGDPKEYLVRIEVSISE